jgi:uncharacterized PurR-regulated membrane protein YhhQ (DUF165 family)
LFVYALLYGGLVVLAGVLGTKISEIGPLHVESGIFAFLMLVVLSSAVAELHGKDTADKLVRYGFIPLILSMALILSSSVCPLPPSGPCRTSSPVSLARARGCSSQGLISYGISQTLNVYVFTKLKGEGSGRAAWYAG